MLIGKDLDITNHVEGSANKRDLLEAHSRKNAPEVFSILPLKSGRFAVLSQYRELFGIADDITEAFKLGQSIPPNLYKRSSKLYAPGAGTARAETTRAAEPDGLDSILADIFGDE